MCICKWEESRNSRSENDPQTDLFFPLCPELLWIIRKRAVCHCLSPNQCWQAEILVLPPRGVWWAEVGQICTWSSFGLTVFGFHCMPVNEQRRVKPWIVSSNKADQKILTLALFLLFFLMTSLLLLHGELARRVASSKEKKKDIVLLFSWHGWGSAAVLWELIWQINAYYHHRRHSVFPCSRRSRGIATAMNHRPPPCLNSKAAASSTCR